MKNNFFKKYFSEVANILNKINVEDIEKLEKAVSEIKKNKIL